MKKKIIFGSVIGLFVALLFIFLLNPIRTLVSIQKVDDFPLYEMHYRGDYGFSGFLNGGAEIMEKFRPKSEALEPYACTCLTAMDGAGGSVFGRNLDWSNDPALILFTDPSDGYASVSMVDMNFLGIHKDKFGLIDRFKLLATPYLPFDGMNEMGLAVGIMSVEHAEGTLDPDFVSLDSLQIIRLMLDQAATVDEAVELISKYNNDFSYGPPVHYLISDASGHSAVIEYIDDEIKVLPNEHPWQVSTNFLFHETEPEQWQDTCPRYQQASDTLENAAGRVTNSEAMAILEDVSQFNTIWSAVYNQTSGDIQLAIGGNYHKVFEFSLKE